MNLFCPADDDQSLPDLHHDLLTGAELHAHHRDPSLPTSPCALPACAAFSCREGGGGGGGGDLDQPSQLQPRLARCTTLVPEGANVAGCETVHTPERDGRPVTKSIISHTQQE